MPENYNAINPTSDLLPEAQIALLQKATRQSWSCSDPTFYSDQSSSHALVGYEQPFTVLL
ncbi:Hypothetical protein P9303_20291 [Prochlorococcus marinus str. MIT 9303]|uniref:Uncharacterized protein n=1 Tax=Prochlorococcus marinus (strain MIT 9303) TaxID=59922 RepID=A2CBB1_PROM3|nr:Hypothetical protein P9303_20291 [Prochlorococcus marinus str. MIT 9303]